MQEARAAHHPGRDGGPSAHLWCTGITHVGPRRRAPSGCSPWSALLGVGRTVLTYGLRQGLSGEGAVVSSARHGVTVTTVTLSCAGPKGTYQGAGTGPLPG